MIKAFSVLLPTLTDQFDTQTWMIGSMVTLMHVVRDLSAPIVGALASIIDTRILVITGGTISGLAIISASFATSVGQLVLFVSVSSGIAFSLMVIPSCFLLSQYFDKFYPLATGVSYSCLALGIMIFAPLTQVLLDTYGWRNAILLLGAICFHLVIVGCLLRPFGPKQIARSTTNDDVDQTYSSLTNDHSNDDDTLGGMGPNSHLSSYEKVCKLVDLSGLPLLKNVSFVATSLLMASISASFTGWIVYFIPHCIVKELSPYEAASLATIAGFAYFIGHFVHIPSLSRGIISVRGAIYIAGIVSVVSLTVDKWITTFTTVLISSVCFCVGAGVGWSLADVHMKSVVDQDVLAQAFGWRMTIASGFRILAGFLVGWLYDQSGSYDEGFFFLGAVQAGGVLVLAADHLRLNMKGGLD